MFKFKKEDKEKKSLVFWIIGILAFAMIFLGTIDMVSAIPPVQTTIQDTGLSIAYPQYQYVPLNTGFNLSIHVYNFSQYFTGTKANCYVDLYSPMGVEIMHSSMRAGSFDYSVPINSSNFTMVGSHSFIIQCNSTTQVGFANGVFEVTESGIELTEGRSLLSLGLLAILVLFMFMSLFYLYQVEDYRGKFVLYWVSHVLFMLITFTGWQMGIDGLLSGMALTGIFRIMFWITAIASFPLIIGSLAWIFYTHTMGEDVRNMVDKGMGVEEAFNRSAKKRYF
jgi:ABC-type transport system involved in multi-copper enzyme maturation permease subunit